MTQYDVIGKTIDKNGVDMETTVAMEELAELIQAISKCKRYGCVGTQRDNLIEEIADVKIVITELLLMFGISNAELIAWNNQKINRMKERLKR